jgi:hypothetical protein
MNMERISSVEEVSAKRGPYVSKPHEPDGRLRLLARARSLLSRSTHRTTRITLQKSAMCLHTKLLAAAYVVRTSLALGPG